VEAIARSISRYPAGDNGGGGRIRRDENPLYWFQFEPKEYLASRDVSLMNAAQRGCHMCLVAECWTDAGYLPSDPRLLYRLARADCSFEQFDAELQTVMASFQLTEDGNRYVHPKLARVWQEKYAGYQQKKAAGKASAAQRKAKASAEKEVA